MRYRWGVYRASLDPTEGHEQAGSRPVLVVSNEAFNRRTGLVTVLPLTTARRDPQRWEVLFPAVTCGLPADSIVLPQQIRTIARERLAVPPYGRLLDPVLRTRVRETVLLHLGFQDPRHLELEE